MIIYELLYNIPPFHAETPYKVFENIVARNLQYDDDVEVSENAINIMDRLMCLDMNERLGIV